MVSLELYSPLVHTADAKPACCSVEGERVIGRTDKVLPQNSAQHDPVKVQICSLNHPEPTRNMQKVLKSKNEVFSKYKLKSNFKNEEQTISIRALRNEDLTVVLVNKSS